MRDTLLTRLTRRLKSGTITRLALTRKIGVSSSTMHRWKERQSSPSGVSRQRLESVLDRLDRKDGAA